ncbi:MAG: hypothetical protein GXP35_17640 [Actinobacteria bacterium]|nr:hypothetical protein [Actinomycetota bacterium]
MRAKKISAVLGAVLLSVVAVSCGSGDSSSGSTQAPAETDAVAETNAPEATDAPAETGAPAETEPVVVDANLVEGITIDGDAADWADVPVLDLTLDAIVDVTAESKDASVKVAHDGENVMVLIQVEDDYNWDPDDAHLSAALGVQWAIDQSAGDAMGATEDDQETSLGMVDIWHWELECEAGVVAGGSTSGPGEGNDAGNDEACNFDDEWSTDTETREDDNGEGAENSLAGAWSHSEPVADADGTWTFEMSRPFDTGDSTDTTFVIGSSNQMAVAYWDSDVSPEGWEDEDHVQSTGIGWIVVNLVG